MKQLTVVVRPFCAETVLEAIQNLGLNSVIVREAKGFSRQKGYLDRYQGSEYNMAFIPKVEITVTVEDERVNEVAEQNSSPVAPVAQPPPNFAPPQSNGGYWTPYPPNFQ